MTRGAWRSRIVLAALAAIPALDPGSGSAEQAKSGASQGTVSGDLTLDGKPLGLRHAVAVSRPDVFDEKREGFTVLMTARPLPAEAIASARIVESVDQAVKEGIILEIGQNAYCKIIIRDRALGGGELQYGGGFVCRDDSVTTWGPDRVEGIVVSFPDGKEEEISKHKVRYCLRFNAPILKRFPLEGDLPKGQPAAKELQDAIVRLWRECEQAIRSLDVKTFLRLSVEDRTKSLSQEQLQVGLVMMLAFMPEKVEAGVVEVAGDHSTLRLFGTEEGKPVHGSALFGRQKGVWKIDVFWRCCSKP